MLTLCADLPNQVRHLHSATVSDLFSAPARMHFRGSRSLCDRPSELTVALPSAVSCCHPNVEGTYIINGFGRKSFTFGISEAEEDWSK